MKLSIWRMKVTKKNNLNLKDIDSHVNERSFAYKKAESLKLEYIGFAYFKDPETNIIKAVSMKEGTRLKLFKEEETKQSLIKAPPTEAGTARFYYIDGGKELHMVTKGYGAKQKWKAASDRDVRTKKAKEEKGKKTIDFTDKNKQLKKVNTANTPVFKVDNNLDDATFAKKNKGNENPEPPPHFKMPKLTRGKYPVKYQKVLERMLNTKSNDTTKAISHFVEGDAGAGQISAQAGELLTMMFSSMDDKTFNKVSQQVLDHTEAIRKTNWDTKKQKQTINTVVDSSWVKAAIGNRDAIHSRIKKQFPGAKVVATCWDTKEEVEALGLDDYKVNKGFSTDMYLKLQDSDGKDILDEVSLKKSTQVNFLNSGISKFKDWDPGLSSELDGKVFRINQRKRLEDGIKKFSSSHKRMMKSNSDYRTSIEKMEKSKKIDTLTAASGKGAHRNAAKVMIHTITELGKAGNKAAEKYLKDHMMYTDNLSNLAVKAITDNKKLRDGLLKEISSEFPLKSVSNGEENMAIGPYSLDKFTMESIFGTSDYDKIKEHLIAETDSKGKPYVGYRAKMGEKTIPIAEIAIREKGKGYSGTPAFEMKLHKDFAKLLGSAHEDVYTKTQKRRKSNEDQEIRYSRYY